MPECTDSHANARGRSSGFAEIKPACVRPSASVTDQELTDAHEFF